MAIPVALASKRPPRRNLFITTAAFVVFIAAISGGYWMFHAYDSQRAEQLRLAIEMERQTAEAQRKANEEKLADVARQRQAVMDAEARERQAKLETETQAAKAALERAEAEKKRLDQELKRTAAEKRAAESAAQKMSTTDKTKREEALPAKAPEPQQAPKEKRPTEPAVPETALDGAKGGAAMLPQITEPQNATKALQAAKQGKELDRFNGTYIGRFCFKERSGMVCWTVALKVEHGLISASWPSREKGKTAYAKGTISADGAIVMKLYGWYPDGSQSEANMTGTCNNDMISVSGTWERGAPVSGNCKREL
jgi:hypothetical protein